jgi:hypothetical protein
MQVTHRIRAWDPEEQIWRDYLLPLSVYKRMEAAVAHLPPEDLEKGSLCQDDEGNFHFKYDE